MAIEPLSISPTAFAEAITELPISALYNKVFELRNSIAHLHRSNSELRLFVLESTESEQDKKELGEYITENEGVIVSMNERVALLRTEVERRGQEWIEEKVKVDQDQDADGEQPRGDSTQDTQEDGVYL
ncbi:uncharacterized protein N7483_011425 [Penicillium malachiteum]|uniref:uncharacterized protein n=1 Tax=Penicillium malachiteum TaxID=1324776 RepID=UPI002546D09B|nr:uncharacterized protein N7483_011425 [Penicillium malachiteum]KAJ5714244.1 hypothetical protein N7483_011425 [Penicillium malachiteum]